MSGRRLYLVVGPTGSGKTDLSIALAQHLCVPIISTDSRQFFREIPIGTAQPNAEQLSAVKHYLVANHTVHDEINAGSYEKEALATLETLFQSTDSVVAVGGSGLYIKALCEGLDELPECSDALRSELRQRYEEQGLEPLLDELKHLDPPHWEVIDRCNPSRVIRALELCHASGGRCSELRTGATKERDFEIIKVGIDLDRELLYSRINRRVELMMEAGLESEVRAVYPYRHLNSLQSVGYRELFDHFDGTINLHEAIELIQRNSRRYAKRQMTWFRRDESIKWFTTLDHQEVINYVDSLL
ncbi:MAG: tRNA (adenosine(37)-N6)-dimethylallyltransferase MiaA [Rikenellaceae bacterium]